MKKTTIAANPRLPEQLIRAHAEAIKRFYDDKGVRRESLPGVRQTGDGRRGAPVDGYAKANVLERVPYVLAPALQAVIDQQSDAKLIAQMKGFDFHCGSGQRHRGEARQEGFFQKLFGPGVKAEEDRKSKLAFK